MSPTKVAKPVDIYIRVSQRRGREGDSFQSPRQQEDRCRSQLKADGLEVGKVFTDLDQSGGKTSRPAFDQALTRARSGESGGIIVHDLTRFGRYASMAQDIILLEESGAVFISCAEKIDTTTSSGRFFLRVMEAMAVMYREQVAERIIDSKRNAVASGIHVTRHTPPGYVQNSNRVLVPHRKHGATIKKAYELAAQGGAPTDIARYLNERELPSGDNEHPVWRSSRIKRLLANRVYLGEARANGEITNPDAHKPLVDEVTWLQAQRKPVAQPLSTSTALLSGLVRCASCRHSMKHQKASSSAPATYRCSRSSEGTTCTCPSTITASKLEDIVIQAFVDRALSEPYEPREQPDDSAALRAALDNAKSAVAEVEALKGELRPVAYAQALDSALADLEEAERAVAQTQGRGFDDQDVALLANAVLPLIAEYEDTETGQRTPIKLDSIGREKVRAALARDIQAVFVRPPAKRSKSLAIEDRVRIVWRDEEELELPVRGTHRELEPYTWDAVAS
jgi:DNA invertase Pin-like site-specific DNA recombinase